MYTQAAAELWLLFILTTKTALVVHGE